MTSPREEEAVSRAIDLLLDCTSARERSAVLLDTLLDTGLCASAALWRQVGRGKVRAWHPVLARGPASGLPTLEQLRAVVSGDLCEDLGGGRVVVLPIEGDEFALTLGMRFSSEPKAADELSDSEDDPSDTIEALFQVWLAVEQAESEGQEAELLDALPSLSRERGAVLPSDLDPQLGPSDRAGSPAQEDQEQAPRAPTADDLRAFLEREAAWILGPHVQFQARTEQLPPLACDPLQLESCLRDLIYHARAGQTSQPKTVAVELTTSATEAPGALVTVDDDGGWPPSLVGSQAGRNTHQLFQVALTVQNLGGSLRIDPSPLGGMRVTLWIPRT